MSQIGDIVGYIYFADQYCPHCIGHMFGAEAAQADKSINVPGAEAEAILDCAAYTLGINRTDEGSYDSGDFPKVITTRMAEHDYGFGADLTCGRCYSPHLPDGN